jgi:hypothetical protein
MADLPLEQIPREGEILEVLYRLSRPAQTHLDLAVATDDGVCRLRFNGARVVQFQEEPPAVLRGLEVQDIRDQNLGDMALWVSVASGAITFWAKSITELAPHRPEMRPPPRDKSVEDVPFVVAEQVRAWGGHGIPQESFRYRAQGSGGMLRHVSVGTRPYL